MTPELEYECIQNLSTSVSGARILEDWHRGLFMFTRRVGMVAAASAFRSMDEGWEIRGKFPFPDALG